MNQIHEDDWAEESWSHHSGMFDPIQWSSDDSPDNDRVAEATRHMIEISRENGYTLELIAEITGLSVEDISKI